MNAGAAEMPEAWDSPRYAAYKLGYRYSVAHPLTPAQIADATVKFGVGLTHGSEDHSTHRYVDAAAAEVTRLRTATR